ncbi:MAG: hypothetical protein ACJASI_001912 [Glaciecola sp.]|jgi:hypothetical protein
MGVHAHLKAQFRDAPAGSQSGYSGNTDLTGHSKLETTALYAQVATKLLHEVVSPLDALKLTH